MTSLMTRKCYETGIFHSFTGLLTAIAVVLLCGCVANNSKNRVTYSWFKFPTELNLF